MKLKNFIGIAGIFFVAFALGMIVQQGITQGTLIKFGESLNGVTLNVNFNETILVDRAMENLDEWFKEEYYKQNGNYDYKKDWIMDDRIYYSNNSDSDIMLYMNNPNYGYNGVVNTNDSDSIGRCWSYNGSDENKDWRMLLVVDNTEIRRCAR